MKKLSVSVLTILALLCLAACSAPVQTNVTAGQDGTPEKTESVSNEKPPNLELQNQYKNIYPAYITQNGQKIWGFIDKNGIFVIHPQYEWVSDFADTGLARVSAQGKVGLINKQGLEIVKPSYSYIYDYYEGVAVAEKIGGGFCAMDVDGNIIFNYKDFIGQFHGGIALIEKASEDGTMLYGYINNEGKVIIEPQFEYAYPFDNHKALIKIKDGKYQLIDETGKVQTVFDYKYVSDLSEDILVYTNEDDLKGYIRSDGKLLINAKFAYAGPFKNGFAVVSTPISSSISSYGVINTSGAYIIKPDYTFIRQLDKCMFAASFNTLIASEDNLVKKAIFNKEGIMLTDFKYYDIDGFSNGAASVSEDTTTYFIDEKGRKVENLPQINGAGTMRIVDGLIKADVDDDLIYLSLDGKIIWQPENIEKLESQAKISRLKYRPDRCMLIYYPEISDLPDKKIQDSINLELKKRFVGNNPVSPKEDGMYTESLSIGFDIMENNDLLTILKDIYCYPVGAAHGTPSREYYHLNINNGRFYTLADLFRSGSGYQEILRNLITKQIEDKNKAGDSMFYPDVSVEITPEIQFAITKESLKIVFQPYEIAPYAAGFPEFDIPFSQLSGIIDTDGELWNSLK